MLPRYLGILYDRRFVQKKVDDVEKRDGNQGEKITKIGLAKIGRGNIMSDANIYANTVRVRQKVG